MFSKFASFGRRVGAGVLVTLGTASAAFAESGIDAALDAVDLTGVSVKVIAMGVLVVGIAMAFKGPVLAKRSIRQV